MPEEDKDEELTEKLVGIALKEGAKVAIELVKPKILGFEDEENPLRYGTVRSVKLIKPSEGSENPTDETDDELINDNNDDELEEACPPSLDERIENLAVGNISPTFDELTIGEIRELLKQLPPQVKKERRTSGYHQYLSKCLIGPREPDISASENIRECNLTWRDLSEEKELKRSFLG